MKMGKEFRQDKGRDEGEQCRWFPYEDSLMSLVS